MASAPRINYPLGHRADGEQMRYVAEHWLPANGTISAVWHADKDCKLLQSQQVKRVVALPESVTESGAVAGDHGCGACTVDDRGDE